MKKQTVFAVGLVAALAAAGATASAQPHQRGPGGFGRGPQGGPPAPAMMLRGVDLTDAQREQARAILDTHRTALEQVAAQLRDAHRGLAEASQGDAVNEAAIRAQSTALANALAEEAILRARVQNELRGILTAEQLQTLRERREAQQKRMEERRQRMEERRTQRESRRPPQ